MELNHDPPVDEVREIRRLISARFDHDPARLVEYYMKQQEQYQDRMIDVAKVEDKEQNAA